MATVFTPASRAREVVVCAFHGLGGDNARHYMQRVVDLGERRGCEVWTVNHRGCGAGRGLARGIYHSGIAPDMSAVVAEIRRHRPGAFVVGVGFSLSANALLLCLGDGVSGISDKPDAVIAINPPIHLARCTELICAPQHRVYALYYLRSCVRYVRQMEEDGLLPRGQYPVHLRMSLKEFDDTFTAPMAGFRDRNDYYERASAMPHLSKITRPTVIIHAEDDPFIDLGDFHRARYGSGVHLHLEKHGGHLGYISREHPHYRWLDYGVGHYLDQLLAYRA